MSGHKETSNRRKLLFIGIAAVVALVFFVCVNHPLPEVGKQQAAEQDAQEEALEERVDEVLDHQTTEADSAEGQEVERYTVNKSLKATGTELLRHYQNQRNCILLRAGYLDLLGHTWGFAVHGAGWADVCIIETAPHNATDVRIVHLT